MFKLHNIAGVSWKTGELAKREMSPNERYSPTECCGAKAGLRFPIQIRDRTIDEDEPAVYHNSFTTGMFFFNGEVDDLNGKALHSYEKHVKLSLGGQQLSMFLVHSYPEQMDSTLPQYPKTIPSPQAALPIWFIYWNGFYDISNNKDFVVGDEVARTGYKYSVDEWKKLCDYYQTRHLAPLKWHKEAHLVWIVTTSQLKGFNATMEKIGLDKKVQRYPTPLVNLNYSKEDNPRLHLFYLEGNPNV